MIINDTFIFIHEYGAVYLILTFVYNLIYASMKGFVGLEWESRDVYRSFLFPLSMMNGIGVIIKNLLIRRGKIKE